VDVAIAAGLVTLAVEASAQANCSSEPLAVQVLGSGGPDAGGTRASSGYLVWRAGRAVVMVDVGGGTFLRFGEAGARLQDLSRWPSVICIPTMSPTFPPDCGPVNRRANSR
jgi:hypothetical protein